MRKGFEFATKCYQIGERRFCKLSYLVDLIGIEPMTSSMPWKCQKVKLLTVKKLETGKTGLLGGL